MIYDSIYITDQQRNAVRNMATPEEWADWHEFSNEVIINKNKRVSPVLRLGFCSGEITDEKLKQYCWVARDVTNIN